AVGAGVGKGRPRLVGRRQAAAQVDGDAAQERGVVGRRRRLQAELLPLLHRKLIDVVIRLEVGDAVERLAVWRNGPEDGNMPHVPGHDRRLAALLGRANQAIAVNDGHHVEVTEILGLPRDITAGTVAVLGKDRELLLLTAAQDGVARGAAETAKAPGT